MFKSLISINDLSSEEIRKLMALAAKVKARPQEVRDALEGHIFGFIFEKPSTRTWVSFQAGIYSMGGGVLYLGPEDIKLGIREEVRDVARVLSRYLSGVVMRTFSHWTITEFQDYFEKPVINGLSDLYHPCQTLADLFTIREKFKAIQKMNIAYIGDGNNVLNSLLYGASKVGANLAIATPRGYEPSEEILRDIKLIAKESGSKITLSNNPFTAIKNAHAIYTDVWVSMGQEKQRDQRVRDFQPFQVNNAIVGKAPKDSVIMHCLPAHRGEEITDDVIENPRSAIFDQAENRLHTQKALIYILLTRKKRKNK